MKQLAYESSNIKCHASFYFWGIKLVLKIGKIPKCYEADYLNFLVTGEIFFLIENAKSISPSQSENLYGHIF